jgi:hypothetical protein
VNVANIRINQSLELNKKASPNWDKTIRTTKTPDNLLWPASFFTPGNSLVIFLLLALWGLGELSK